jgi:hypothetical protein
MTAAPASGVNFYVLHIAGTLESSVVPAAGTTVPGAFGVSGDLTVDTDVLKVDATNNRVGIGTASPTQATLHVAGGGVPARFESTSSATTYVQFGASGTSNYGQIAMNGNDMTLRTAYTDRMKIDGSGNIMAPAITLGNGTTYAAANTLDDYEEGAFTPTIVRSISNPSYTASVAQGHYTKIGNVVHLQIMIIVSSVSSSGSGNMRISGLPFGGGTAPTYSHVLNVGYNDTFDSAIKDCYVSGSNLQFIPTGITQSNYGGVLSTGYLGICGTYLTT